MAITAIKKAQKNESLDVRENNFGMTLISANKKLPVESLKFNRQYQRATQPARKENVKQSIIKCGHFLPDQSITVNQNYEVVDGQHRLLAAMDLKISHIPATIYSFSSKVQEAAFFVHINGFDQRLNQVDYWYGSFLSGDPLAIFMYRLESEPMSRLCDKIVIKGKNTGKKISTSMTLAIIMHSIGIENQNWSKAIHQKILKRLDDYGPRSLVYVNDFVDWYESIFGTKNDNPVAYQLDIFRAIVTLHTRLSNAGIANHKLTINKMRTFNLGTAFVTAPLQGKKYQLIDHFNKGRQKNRIPYNLEKE